MPGGNEHLKENRCILQMLYWCGVTKAPILTGLHCTDLLRWTWTKLSFHYFTEAFWNSVCYIKILHVYKYLYFKVLYFPFIFIVTCCCFRWNVNTFSLKEKKKSRKQTKKTVGKQALQNYDANNYGLDKSANRSTEHILLKLNCSVLSLSFSEMCPFATLKERIPRVPYFAFLCHQIIYRNPTYSGVKAFFLIFFTADFLI